MKRLFLLFAIIAISFQAQPVIAQKNYTESITITTYYPAPYGVYRNLKLNPSDAPTGSALSEGVMYYDRNSHVIKYWNNTSWVNISDSGGGSGASAGDILVGAAHTQGDCTSAGGKVEVSGATLKLCRFTLPACPTGWQPYLNWSNTTARTCVGGQCCGSGNTGCSVGGHPWSNTAIEHCQYFGAAVYCGQGFVNCQGGGYCYGCGYNYLMCPCADCQATVNEIGCQ